jgi:hypothetical protein
MIEIVVKVEGNRKKLLKLLPLFVFTHVEYQVRTGAASRYWSGSTKRMRLSADSGTTTLSFDTTAHGTRVNVPLRA